MPFFSSRGEPSEYSKVSSISRDGRRVEAPPVILDQATTLLDELIRPYFHAQLHKFDYATLGN